VNPRSDISSFVYRLASGFDGTLCASLMACATGGRRQAAEENKNPKSKRLRKEYGGGTEKGSIRQGLNVVQYY